MKIIMTILSMHLQWLVREPTTVVGSGSFLVGSLWCLVYEYSYVNSPTST